MCPEATEFGEIAQHKGHYAVQGHLRPHNFGTSRKLIICDFLLVINANLPPILHRLQDIAFDRSNIAIFGYRLVFNSPDRGVPLGRSPQKFFVDVNGWPRYQMP